MIKNHINIDIETFSDVDLNKAGLYKYVESSAFEILLFGYSVNNSPTTVIDLACGEEIPVDVITLMLNENTTLHAYNATFEWLSLCKHFKASEKFKFKWLNQWRCTMFHGLYAGYPSGLAKVAKALNLPSEKLKDSKGKALIRLFCSPVRPTKANGNKTRIMPADEPEKWNEFKNYCAQDVVVEKEVLDKFSEVDIPNIEQELWRQDIRINSRGILVDPLLVKNAVDIDTKETEVLMGKMKELTGLDNPNSVTQLKAWLAEKGIEVNSLAKDKVQEILDETKCQKIHEVLYYRSQTSKASISKYQAIKNSMCEDGRIRGLLQVYGANRTGRYAGRLVQVHNLAKNNIKGLSYARELVKKKDVNTINYTYGSAAEVLSNIIRTAFIAKENSSLLISDFSAIEARILSWLAQEKWRLEVFETHGKIYEASASAMFNVPIEKIKRGNPEYALRQKGKIAELALGYQGADGALITMGALDNGLREDELPDIVSRWRNSNPAIVTLWEIINNSVFETVRSARTTLYKDLLKFSIEILGDLKYLTVTLPSNRKLYYANPSIGKNRWGWPSVTYMDYQSGQWRQCETYGGKITENVCQAIARDCLTNALLNLEKAGYAIIMHVHDEVVIEIEKEKADLNAVNKIMGLPISWAPGLKLKAEGFLSDYYMKD